MKVGMDIVITESLVRARCMVNTFSYLANTAAYELGVLTIFFLQMWKLKHLEAKLITKPQVSGKANLIPKSNLFFFILCSLPGKEYG